MNPWQKWLDAATDSASDRRIADLLGKSHTTIGRWKNKRPPSCADIIAIARTFDADPIEGMVAAGWLKESDFTMVGLRSAISRAPAVMLADELHGRLRSGKLEGEMGEIRRMFR